MSKCQGTTTVRGQCHTGAGFNLIHSLLMCSNSA